jgi:hypothetical protein
VEKLNLHFHFGCSGGGVKIKGGVIFSVIYVTFFQSYVDPIVVFYYPGRSFRTGQDPLIVCLDLLHCSSNDLFTDTAGISEFYGRHQ